MILQTLQQLRDVYGESVDKIVSSNTAVFIYLISNDTDMLQDLSRQAGNTHVSRPSSKNVTKDVGALYNATKSDVSYTYSTQEEPLFSVDKLMSFTNGEAMVLSSVHRADNSGEAVRPNPIYNTDKTIMPMAYALHKKGHNNSLFKTAVANAEVATSSSGQDVYQTIPDFNAMYQKRVDQAKYTQHMIHAYKEEESLSDQDLIRRDINVVSESVMRMINAKRYDKERQEELISEMSDIDDLDQFDEYDQVDGDESSMNDSLNNTERKILESSDFDEGVVQTPNSSRLLTDKEKIYQDDVRKTEDAVKQQEELKRQMIYLNGEASYTDIANNNRIYDFLSEVLVNTFKNTQNNNIMVSAEYEYVKNSNSNHTIKHKSTGKVMFSYSRVQNEDTSITDEWIVHDEFKQLVRETATKGAIDVTDKQASRSQNVYLLNQNEVNNLFKIDDSDIIYYDLSKKLKEDKINNVTGV